MKASTSLEAVLGEVDGVVVATPNNLHAAVAKIALERGVPVLVEKPVATTFADAQELAELAERHGTFVLVGYNSRHAPAALLFERLLRERFLGKLQHFHFEFGTAGGWAPLSGYNLDRKQSGGGVLVTTGTHSIDRMLAWFGYPSKIRYADDSFGGVEGNCRCWMEFDNELGNFTGSLFFSKTAALKNLFKLEAEDYAVEMPAGADARLTLRPARLPGTVMFLQDQRAPESVNSYQLQIEHFARAIRGLEPPLIDGRSGAESLRFIEQCYGNRQQLEEPWAWYINRRAVNA
jgi:predicted dehydrogenase